RREEALCRELLLQPLQRGEVVAEAEALERERAQPELAARLVELRTAVDVDAVAVGKLESQRVELAAWHRDAEAGAVGRARRREEDAGRPCLAAKLGPLALDPYGRQAREPRRDAAVERPHRIDPAVAVVDRLDLHEAEAR